MMATGISNGDEIQIRQILRTFASLAEVYRTIDYGVLGASKTHTHLAAHYLGQSVISVIPHKMPDVLMDGVNVMGVTAKTSLMTGDWQYAPSIYDNIFKAAVAGAMVEEYRPVTQASMSVFAELAFELLRTPEIDAKMAAETINENILQISKIYLTTPDMPLMSNHAMALGPYFSVTVFDGFCSKLRVLANSVLNADAQNEDAKNVVRNMSEWSGSISKSHGEVLEWAIEKRSFLTQHILQWVEHVVTALMAVAWAPACSERKRESLWENATDILDILNVSPENKETAGFLNNFQWNETIFDIGTEAWNRDADPVLDRANHILTRWAFVAGRFQTGWANLERSLLGLAALATLGDNHQDRRTFLLDNIRFRLAQPESLSQELLDRTARELRGHANNLRENRHSFSSIEHAVGSANPDRMRPTLIEIADAISPGTIGQANDRMYF